MARSSPSGVRAVAAVAFFGIGLVHLELLPQTFRQEAYLGVTVLLSFGMAVVGGILLLCDDRNPVWWYALAEGVLNALGYALTRNGMPLIPTRLAGGWTDPRLLALAYASVLLAGLSAWVLLTRRVDRRRDPVTSARDRARLPDRR